MQLPETTIVSQSLLKMGLRNANQVTVFSEGFSTGGLVYYQFRGTGSMFPGFSRENRCVRRDNTQPPALRWKK
jgi:hypothetical protein